MKIRIGQGAASIYPHLPSFSPARKRGVDNIWCNLIGQHHNIQLLRPQPVAGGCSFGKAAGERREEAAKPLSARGLVTLYWQTQSFCLPEQEDAHGHQQRPGRCCSRERWMRWRYPRIPWTWGCTSCWLGRTKGQNPRSAGVPPPAPGGTSLLPAALQPSENANKPLKSSAFLP